MYFRWIACILASEGLEEQVCEGSCSQCPHLYTTYDATYDLKWTDNELFDKTVFPQIYTPNFCISAQEGPRK